MSNLTNQLVGFVISTCAKILKYYVCKFVERDSKTKDFMETDVPCEDFEQNCFSTFESATYNQKVFPVFHYAKP